MGMSDDVRSDLIELIESYEDGADVDVVLDTATESVLATVVTYAMPYLEERHREAFRRGYLSGPQRDGGGGG